VIIGRNIVCVTEFLLSGFARQSAMDGIDGLFKDAAAGEAGQPGRTPTTMVSVPKPPDVRNASNLVGLDNQGATCYLNSLLQAMFFTPELRFGLFRLDPENDLGADVMDEEEQAKKEEKKEPAAGGASDEADENMVTLMADMGIDAAEARVALTAVKNQGVSQAMEYLFTNEAHVKQAAEVAKALAKAQAQAKAPAPGGEVKKKKRKARTIPLELQRLFVQMQLLDRKSLSTQGTCPLSYGLLRTSRGC